MRKGTAETMLFQGKIPQSHGACPLVLCLPSTMDLEELTIPLLESSLFLLLLQAMHTLASTLGLGPKPHTRPIGHGQQLCRGRVNL